MDTLSVELHAQIFEYACLDNGSTARSLALVSRHVSTVARPFLYQSLSVHGPTQIHALIERLAPLPHYLRRIRHLHLRSMQQQDTLRTESRTVRLGLRDTRRALRKEAQEAAERLLAFAAPTVEKLALADTPRMVKELTAHLFMLQPPHLRELAARGRHFLYSFRSVGAAAERPIRSMPRLERLYLDECGSPSFVLSSGTLKDAYPALEYLVLSGVIVVRDVAMRDLADKVEGAVRCMGSENVDEAGDSPLPHSLRRIVIEMETVPQMNARTHASHANTLDILERIAEGSGGKIVVRRADSQTSEDSHTVAGWMLRSWCEMVEGGKGWWEDV